MLMWVTNFELQSFDLFKNDIELKLKCCLPLHRWYHRKNNINWSTGYCYGGVMFCWSADLLNRNFNQQTILMNRNNNLKQFSRFHLEIHVISIKYLVLITHYTWMLCSVMCIHWRGKLKAKFSFAAIDWHTGIHLIWKIANASTLLRQLDVLNTTDSMILLYRSGAFRRNPQTQSRKWYALEIFYRCGQCRRCCCFCFYCCYEWDHFTYSWIGIKYQFVLL